MHRNGLIFFYPHETGIFLRGYRGPFRTRVIANLNNSADKSLLNRLHRSNANNTAQTGVGMKLL